MHRLCDRRASAETLLIRAADRLISCLNVQVVTRALERVGHEPEIAPDERLHALAVEILAFNLGSLRASLLIRSTVSALYRHRGYAEARPSRRPP
jgi:hypothetical protein